MSQKKPVTKSVYGMVPFISSSKTDDTIFFAFENNIVITYGR